MKESLITSPRLIENKIPLSFNSILFISGQNIITFAIFSLKFCIPNFPASLFREVLAIYSKVVHPGDSNVVKLFSVLFKPSNNSSSFPSLYILILKPWTSSLSLRIISPMILTFFDNECVVKNPVPKRPVLSPLFILPSLYLYNKAVSVFIVKGEPL